MKIILEGIEIFCIIGIYPREKAKKQKLIINAELTLNDLFSPVNLNDNIENTIDYDKIANIIKAFEKLDTNLIETIAINASEAIVESDAKIASCKVQVKKPHVINGVKSVAAEYCFAR